MALAGAATDFFFGQEIAMMPHYVCHKDSQTQPVYALKPNGLGFFGTTGSIWEWCHVAADTDDETGREMLDDVRRLIAGGTYSDPPEKLRSPCRVDNHPAALRSEYIGFRVFRTLPDQSSEGTDGTSAHAKSAGRDMPSSSASR
jgi:formylglycine-generating enzyme required for sulfatase activity